MCADRYHGLAPGTFEQMPPEMRQIAFDKPEYQRRDLRIALMACSVSPPGFMIPSSFRSLLD